MTSGPISPGLDQGSAQGLTLAQPRASPGPAQGLTQASPGQPRSIFGQDFGQTEQQKQQRGRKRQRAQALGWPRSSPGLGQGQALGWALVKPWENWPRKLAGQVLPRRRRSQSQILPQPIQNRDGHMANTDLRVLFSGLAKHSPCQHWWVDPISTWHRNLQIP